MAYLVSGYSNWTIVRFRDSRPETYGIHIPVLIYDGKAFMPALKWLVDKSSWLHQRKPPTQKKALSAIGRLLDFYFALQKQNCSENVLKELLSKFHQVLANGSIIQNEHGEYEDPYGLWWPPRAETSVKDDLNYIEEFVLYSHLYLDGFRRADVPLAYFLRQLESARKFERSYPHQSPYDFMRHLHGKRASSGTEMHAKRVRHWNFDLRNKVSQAITVSVGNNRQVKKFALENILPLVFQGTKSRRRKSGLYFQQYNVRDQLMFLLILFGGIRVGALCNLFSSDVKPWPHMPGERYKKRLLVRIAHPELAIDEVVLGASHDRLTRKEHLWKYYQLRPRNKLLGKDFVSLKYLALDDGRTKDTYLVLVAPTALQEHMYNIFHQYVVYVRPKLVKGRPKHPYFFVNDHGAPMKYRNVLDQWQSACRKIGLTGRMEDGQHPHSGRHFILNFAKNSLGLSTQNLMSISKHKDPSSLSVYTVDDVAEIQSKINRSFEALRNNDVSAEKISLSETASKIDPFHLFESDLCQNEM